MMYYITYIFTMAGKMFDILNAPEQLLKSNFPQVWVIRYSCHLASNTLSTSS